MRGSKRVYKLINRYGFEGDKTVKTLGGMRRLIALPEDSLRVYLSTLRWSYGKAAKARRAA